MTGEDPAISTKDLSLSSLTSTHSFLAACDSSLKDRWDVDGRLQFWWQQLNYPRIPAASQRSPRWLADVSRCSNSPCWRVSNSIKQGINLEILSSLLPWVNSVEWQSASSRAQNVGASDRGWQITTSNLQFVIKVFPVDSTLLVVIPVKIICLCWSLGGLSSVTFLLLAGLTCRNIKYLPHSRQWLFQSDDMLT